MLWLASLICLIPMTLYLLRIIKDPFHPALFVGTLAFFVTCYKPLKGLEPSLQYVSQQSLAYFLGVVSASILAFYLGFLWHARRHRGDAPASVVEVQYDPHRLMGFGVLYLLLAIPAYLYTRQDYGFTGYVRDIGLLWISAFILILQAILLKRQMWMVGVFFLALALIPPVDRFFIYGQRGDTFRLAVLFLPIFLFLNKRPPRAIFIPAALALALVLSVLHMTRGLVDNGYAPNRIQALVQVLKGSGSSDTERYYGTEEHVFGAAMVQAVRDNNLYDYGRFVIDIGVRFVPKELLDKTSYYSPWSRPYAGATTGEMAGYAIPFGAMPTGFAHAFVEFWWATIFFWGALGYWIRHRYVSAITSGRLEHQAYFTILFVVLLYLITQDLMDSTMNLMYTFLPLAFAYRKSRVQLHAVHDSGGEMAESSGLLPASEFA